MLGFYFILDIKIEILLGVFVSKERWWRGWESWGKESVSLVWNKRIWQRKETDSLITSMVPLFVFRFTHLKLKLIV